MALTSLLLTTLLVSPPAGAASDEWSAYGTDELSTDFEGAPPAVIFVLDLSSDMQDPCTGSVGTPCIEDVKDVLLQVTRHFDWAHFGVIGTNSDAGNPDFQEIVPVGSTDAELAAALGSVTTHAGSTNNLAEVLISMADDYFERSSGGNGVDDDSDGFTGDWDEAPFSYSCQKVHVVVFTSSHPSDDDQQSSSEYNITPGTDILCGSGDNCYYDNVVAGYYAADFVGWLDGTQNAVVHTIGLGITAGSEEDNLYRNAADETSGEGIYTVAQTRGEILSATLGALAEIASGTFSRSTPVLSAAGDSLVFDYFELTGDNPLARGHVRNYEVDDDPASSTYGQVLYGGSSALGGALWDAGERLRGRASAPGESNPDDRDGDGARDIYFYEDGAAAVMAAEVGNRRLGFDAEFVAAVDGTAALGTYIDLTQPSVNCRTDDYPYDLNKDCVIDIADLQTLVDFVRGVPTTEFKYLDHGRGDWRLGDSPYSVPVIVTPRNNNFSVEPTYRAFLDTLEASGMPSVVIVPANDGMIHAFQLEDDPSTGMNDAGVELWAWVSGYLLLRDQPTEWAPGLIDLMWYGRTFLFDGTPVVEDVWIDDDAPSSASYNLKEVDEWHRVLVVQQGLGGPSTLALDITDVRAPRFMWDHVNAADPTAQGYTVSRPAVFNVYDATDSTLPHDRWVAMWGGGQAVAYTGPSLGTDYFRSTEANLYMWNIGDDIWGTNTVGFANAGNNIGDAHPDLVANGGLESTASLNLDADSSVENTYISAPVAAVDVDGDGDGDVLYFPVTTTYRPKIEGGGGPADVAVPGSTWLYKAIIDPADPDVLTWCKFYDPAIGTDGSNGIPSSGRPEVYYAVTTAFLPDGRLGVYWGTGSPFSRDTTDEGFFFAMADDEPTECSSDAKPISCLAEDGTTSEDGFFQLNAAEGLTGDPIVVAGVVYFTTYEPASDRCEDGVGRLYGLRYDDCSAGIDTDGDGFASSSDATALTYDTYISGVTAGQGTVFFGTANPTVDGTGDAVGTITTTSDPFLGTTSLAWLEMY